MEKEEFAQDVSQSTAFQELKALEESGADKKKIALCREAYINMHNLVLKLYSNETELLDHAKELNKELNRGKEELEKLTQQSYDNSSDIGACRRDLAKAEEQAAQAQENESFSGLKLEEYRKRKQEQETKIEALKKAKGEELAPTIALYRTQVNEIKNEIESLRQQEERLNREKNEGNKKVSEISKQKEKLEIELLSQRTHLMKIKDEPTKLKKQADVVEQAAVNLEEEWDRLMPALYELQTTLGTHRSTVRELEEERIEVMLVLERQRVNLQNKARQCDQLEKDLHLLKDTANNHHANRVKQEMDLKMAGMEARREAETLAKKTREKESLLKQVKKMEIVVGDQGPTLTLKRDVESRQRELDSQSHERARKDEAVQELRREVDAFISMFLKQEQNDKQLVANLRALLDINKELEAELTTRRQQKHELDHEYGVICTQMEKKSIQAAQKLVKLREVSSSLKVYTIDIADLQKKESEKRIKLKELEKLYEIVKNEKNRYLNLIQASEQGCGEMAEKLKILRNEIDILRAESAEKDRMLLKERLEYQNAFVARDSLRNETNKLLLGFRKQQEEIDKQIAQVDKLNGLINIAERRMVSLKQDYQNAVEGRNFMGIQLLERNDELCVLYEKANVQEERLKTAEAEYQRRDEEIKMLNIIRADCERDKLVQHKMMPQVPKLENEIVSLQMELLEERNKAKRLAQDLESPENLERWRKLGGRDPSSKDLTEKLQLLEERLNEKQEQLLEKNLVLSEVAHLVDQLQVDADSNNTDTLALAKKINEFRARLRSVTKKLTATVAELSMLQAEALKLQQQHAFLTSTVDEARVRLEQGEPPTDSAENEWARMERDRMLHQEQLMRRKIQEEGELSAMLGDDPLTRTTAVPRPNAYLPDEDEDALSIPRPFGGAAPFKPTVAGSSMRHYRKPKPLEIEF